MNNYNKFRFLMKIFNPRQIIRTTNRHWFDYQLGIRICCFGMIIYENRNCWTFGLGYKVTHAFENIGLNSENVKITGNYYKTHIIYDDKNLLHPFIIFFRLLLCLYLKDVHWVWTRWVRFNGNQHLVRAKYGNSIIHPVTLHLSPQRRILILSYYYFTPINK